MRMMLTSGGMTAGPILDELQGLLAQPLNRSRCVVVIDAILPFPGDKSRLIADLEQLRRLGWAQVDVLSLLAGPRPLVESRLRSSDVVLCYGGSNHWLAHAWTSTGLAPVLRELLEEKVYVGRSAGSMIFSRQHGAVVEAFDDHEEVRMLGLESVAPALPLFDWAAAGAARLGSPVWFLDDATALIVRDPAAAPEVVSTGHWLRFGDRGRLLDSA